MSLRRLTAPRVEPRQDILGKTEATVRAPNVRATIAHNPALAKAVGGLTGAVLREGSTSRRQRELVILRAGWNCQSEYEFGQHTLFGKEAGISDEEVVALTRPLTAHPWSDDDRVLLQMADDLRVDFTITDETWAEMAARWSLPEIFEFMFAVLSYMMVSGFLNATGVQRESDVPGWPGD
jgi:4-carboxymuconolactone decarboxylase